MAANVRIWFFTAAAALLLVVDVADGGAVQSRFSSFTSSAWSGWRKADPEIDKFPEQAAAALASNVSDPLAKYPCVRMHLERPYGQLFLRLLLASLSPSVDTWVKQYALARAKLSDDALAEFHSRACWYMNQYPSCTYNRILDMLEFYFNDYRGRHVDETDADAWRPPNQGDFITKRFLDDYVEANGLQDLLDDDIDIPAWRFEDDDDRAKYLAAASCLGKDAGAVTSVLGQQGAPAPGPVRDDDAERSASVLGQQGAPAPGPVRDDDAERTASVAAADRGQYECLRRPASSTASRMAASDLSGFPDAATLNVRWWTEVGAASGVFAVVVLALVTLLLADTHMFHVMLPDPDAEQREVHYVLSNGERISVRPGAPPSQYAPVAPPTW